MPSRNPLTGKRLSGPEQQRLKAARTVSWKRLAVGQEQPRAEPGPAEQPTVGPAAGTAESHQEPQAPQTADTWDSFVPTPSTKPKRAARGSVASPGDSVSHPPAPLPAPVQTSDGTSSARTALVVAPVAPVVVELPVPPSFSGLKPPPQGVSEIESWAAGLNLRAATAAEEADEHSGPRVEAVIVLCRELGRLSVKAARSEKAVRLRKLRLNESGDIDLASPPFDDPVASVAWAYYRLAQLAHEAAVSAKWFPDPRQIAVARALAGAGFLPCNDALAAVADRVRSQG